ncbi:MAG: hypothetical protein V3V76_00450 [Candidatus Adiutricales bacterium]
MRSTIRIDLTVPMEMRDGTVLRADVFHPNDDDRYLVILTRPLTTRPTPRKSLPRSRGLGGCGLGPRHPGP